jgi:hypothetical protein
MRSQSAASSHIRPTEAFVYATENWKHSAFGNKIIEASKWRDEGIPISIVSEANWVEALS